MTQVDPRALLPMRRRGDLDHPGAGPLTAVAALLSVAAVAETASRGLVQPRIGLAFAALIVVGEIVRVRLPGDRELAPVGVAAALAYALVLDVGREKAQHSAWQVVAVTAFAVTLGSLPHLAAGRSARLDDLARRVLLAGVAAAVFRPFASHLRGNSTTLILAMLGAALVASAVDVALASVVRAAGQFRRLVTAAHDEVRAAAGIGLAIGATGVLIALAARPLGLWALPVFTVPLLVTQISVRRYAAIRATSLQTIRALSRVTEVGGYVEPGHSRRVSAVAVALGREFALNESDLLDLEYAALMHDIGQLSFSDPIPGGATLVVAPPERRRIAELGAEIIRTTGTLERVAEIVERQADAYRLPGAGADAGLPLSSRIIKVANAYDDLVGDRIDRATTEAALERLRLGSISEYDPRVVEALDRVLRRSGLALTLIS
ncbi:MAG: HD-GYP domain-containing protein [Actinomycetes bacterium]